MGRLFLLQQIFPTQELKQGLLPCRQIFYQLGYHGSPKWKWKSFNCVWFCDPTWTVVHGTLQPRILEWVAFPSPGHLPNWGIKPRSPALQMDSLPSEPQGKATNTGVLVRMGNKWNAHSPLVETEKFRLFRRNHSFL